MRSEQDVNGRDLAEPRSAGFRGWWTEAALVAGFVVITALLWSGRLLRLDVAVDEWSRTHRPTALYLSARLGNYLGQGTYLFVLCLAIAVYLGRRRRTVRLVLPVIATELLSAVVVLALKLALYRAPPRNQNHVPHPERLFSDPASQSYPSGHLVVALVWYGMLAYLLTGLVADRWRTLLRAVPPAVLFVTTVYLSFHWLTDTVAGLLLGVLLYRLIMRVPWRTMPLGNRIS